MSRIALVTNSAAALPPELIARYNITLAPLQLHFINGNYEEGSDIGLDEFYARLVREEVVPSTSPPVTLRYMRNSRRVGTLVALLATWLNIVPVIRMSAGKLELIERARSWEAALDRQIAELTRFFAGTVPMEIGGCAMVMRRPKPGCLLNVCGPISRRRRCILPMLGRRWPSTAAPACWES